MNGERGGGGWGDFLLARSEQGGKGNSIGHGLAKGQARQPSSASAIDREYVWRLAWALDGPFFPALSHCSAQTGWQDKAFRTALTLALA